jgi:hypothetical protein
MATLEEGGHMRAALFSCVLGMIGSEQKSHLNVIDVKDRTFLGRNLEIFAKKEALPCPVRYARRAIKGNLVLRCASISVDSKTWTNPSLGYSRSYWSAWIAAFRGLPSQKPN